MGGKWTTYRKMGQDVVDLLAVKEKEQGKEIPKTQTKGLPLLGSAPETLRTLMVKEKGHVGAQLYHTFGWLAEEVSKGELKPVYGSTSMA
jgi:glycerol-3-phosphate dehydrogenase